MPVTQKQVDLLLYRWEFLRRNKKYIKDSKKVRNMCEEYGKKGEDPPRIIFEPIFKKYGLYINIDPGLKLTPRKIRLKSYEGIDLIYSERGVQFCLPFSVLKGPNQIVVPFDNNYGIRRINPFLPAKEIKKRFFLVALDLYAPDYRILNDIEEWIRWEKKKRKIRFRKQIRVNDFEKYLQIYDLREKKQSWPEIVKVVFLKQIGTNTDRQALKPLIEKARANYKACKRFIESDYRFLM